MKNLAEFIVKSRIHAVLVVALCVGSIFLAWLGAAALALVTLRKGLAEGLYVLAWAILPAGAIAYYGNDTGPITTLIGITLSAAVLRSTVSLSAALQTASLCGLATAAVLSHFSDALLGEVYTELQALFESMPIELPSQAAIAAMLGLSTALSIAIALLLARWWQAVQVNPGGFREEFHRLRIPPASALALVLTAGLLLNLGGQYAYWVLIVLMPFVFAGLGLVHGVVGIKNMGQGWLTGFYIVWLFIGLAKVLLIAAAVIDSWIDIRSRLARQSAEP